MSIDELSGSLIVKRSVGLFGLEKIIGGLVPKKTYSSETFIPVCKPCPCSERALVKLEFLSGFFFQLEHALIQGTTHYFMRV